MFPKSREPAASMSDPQTGGQTPLPPSLPSPRKLWTRGRSGLLLGAKESREAGWTGCCLEGAPTGSWGWGAQLSPRMPRRTRGHGPQSSWRVTGFPEEPSRSPTSSSIRPLRECMGRWTLSGRLQGPSPPCHWALPISASRIGRKGGIFRSRHSSYVPLFLRGYPEAARVRVNIQGGDGGFRAAPSMSSSLLTKAGPPALWEPSLPSQDA